MFAHTFKTVAIAAAVVVATASASFAASAYIDHDAKVKSQPTNKSQTVNWVEEGQKVQIVAHSGSWVKVKIPGKDGWVKENALDYAYAPYPVYDDYYGPGYGASVCLGGPLGSLCVSD
jgi:uncharacterized protein YraI